MPSSVVRFRCSNPLVEQAHFPSSLALGEWSDSLAWLVVGLPVSSHTVRDCHGDPYESQNDSPAVFMPGSFMSNIV